MGRIDGFCSNILRQQGGAVKRSSLAGCLPACAESHFSKSSRSCSHVAWPVMTPERAPTGTTIAGVHELEKAGVRAAFINAVLAAATRADELASKL